MEPLQVMKSAYLSKEPCSVNSIADQEDVIEEITGFIQLAAAIGVNRYWLIQPQTFIRRHDFILYIKVIRWFSDIDEGYLQRLQN